MGRRSVESLQPSNNTAAALMEQKMDWCWAGLLLFREPSPSVCAGWAGHWARHEQKTEDTEANEGTLPDTTAGSRFHGARGSSSSQILQLALSRAGGSFLILPTTARPCLSRPFFFEVTQQWMTLTWKTETFMKTTGSLSTCFSSLLRY